MSIALLRIEGPDADVNLQRNDQEISLSLPIVLGRGSLLKCGDKKVSRRHAYMDWDDDGVLITSVHQSPTFVVVRDRQEELTEGSSSLLTHGDKFGLLKDAFWFMVKLPDAAVKEEEQSEDIKKANDNEEVGSKQEDEKKSEEPAGVSQSDTTDVGGKSCKSNDTKVSSPDAPTKENRKVESEKKNKKANVEVENGEINDDLHDAKEVDVKNESANQEKLQEIQKAISQRKRTLPDWIVKSKGVKAPDKGEKEGHTHGGGGVRKTRPAPAKRKIPTENEDSAEVQHSPKNAKQSPQKKNAAASKKKTSPAKRGGKTCHDMSEEDSEDEISAPRGKTLTNKAIASPKNQQKKSPVKVQQSPSPLKHGGKTAHDMSEDDSEEEVSSPKGKGQTNSNNDAKSSPKKKQRKLPVKPRQSPSKPQNNNAKHHDMSEDDGSDEDGVLDSSVNTAAAGTAPATAPKRKKPRRSCQYGNNCYRKNPKHRSDYAHPGDADYKDESSESEDDPNDDRPQCEYGIDCFRKNPQHRKDYRHSRVPQPKRKAKRKAPKRSAADSDSEDDYDYDDPFFNDDSSDDYAPTDSGTDSPMEEADEEEDTKRMLKEGKRFVRKKRQS